MPHASYISRINVVLSLASLYQINHNSFQSAIRIIPLRSHHSQNDYVMHSYSVRKLVPLTVLSFRLVTKCRVTVYVLNIFVGNLSPAFRKIIRLEKNPV